MREADRAEVRVEVGAHGAESRSGGPEVALEPPRDRVHLGQIMWRGVLSLRRDENDRTSKRVRRVHGVGRARAVLGNDVVDRPVVAIRPAAEADERIGGAVVTPGWIERRGGAAVNHHQIGGAVDRRAVGDDQHAVRLVATAEVP